MSDIIYVTKQRTMSFSKSNNRQKNQKRYGKKSKNAYNSTSVPIESLDRFAGSSEDEDDNEKEIEPQDNDDDDADGNDPGIEKKISSFKSNALTKAKNSYPKNQSYDSDADVDDNIDDDDDDDDDDESNEPDDKLGSSEEDDNGDILDVENENDDMEPQFHIMTGIANAMNRILNAPTKTSKKIKAPASSSTTNAVVLSKTKTPLQIQAEKEKKMLEELKETRRIKRERQIKALHIPLTVATNSFVVLDGNNKSAISMELEAERMHRRVATRGIVALFNAIAQHQVRPDQTAEQAAAATIEKSSSKTSNTVASTGSSPATKLTKHGFLDLIKQKAITAAAATSANSSNDTKPIVTVKDVLVKGSKSGGNDSNMNNNTSTSKKWNALRDDYMMDSTKNWDELEDNDNDNDHDGDTFQDSGKNEPSKKKIRSRKHFTMDEFRAGVTACLRSWSALRTAVQNEWGGSTSVEKAETLRSEILQSMIQKKVNDVIDLEDALAIYMEEEFSIVLDDNSEKQIADTIFKMYGEACLNQTTLALRVIQLAEKVTKEFGHLPLHIQSSEPMEEDDDDDNDSDDSNENGMANADDNTAMDMNPTTATPPVVSNPAEYASQPLFGLSREQKRLQIINKNAAQTPVRQLGEAEVEVNMKQQQTDEDGFVSVAPKSRRNKMM